MTMNETNGPGSTESQEPQDSGAEPLKEASGSQCDCVARRAAMAAGVGVFGAGYAGAIGYPVYRYLSTPVRRAASAAAVTEVSLPEAASMEPGTATMFMFGTRTAILIRHEDEHYTAFDATCTHLGCTVKYEPENKRIFCACHGGVYDPETGDALAGPPPKGLTVYRVENRDGEIVVARM